MSFGFVARLSPRLRGKESLAMSARLSDSLLSQEEIDRLLVAHWTLLHRNLSDVSVIVRDGDGNVVAYRTVSRDGSGVSLPPADLAAVQPGA